MRGLAIAFLADPKDAGECEEDIDIHGDPAEIWRSWLAGTLDSAPIHSGHHQAEQAPDDLADALIAFLTTQHDR